MSRDIKESTLRAKEREIQELRAALLELVRIALLSGSFEVKGDESSILTLYNRAIEAGEISLDRVPEVWRENVGALHGR